MTYSILWGSPHGPLESQREELTRLFGPYELVSMPQWRSVTDLTTAYFAMPEPRELVLVAPLSVCREVIKRGIKPLSPRTITLNDTRVSDTSREWLHKGRVIRFRNFSRRVSVDETFEPVYSREEIAHLNARDLENSRQ